MILLSTLKTIQKKISDNKYYHRAFLNKIMIIAVVFKQKISFYLRKVLYCQLEI